MSAGFTRRFSSLPATDVITQIEGVVIVDNAPVGLQGQSTGVVAVVGEFADMTYATSVSDQGVVSESIQPIAIESALDVSLKLGDFDSTLGNIGNANGNGWLAIQNKTFSGLVAVPVNLCSDKAVRLFRSLPVCTSASDPTPVGGSIPGAVVAAGTEFADGSSNKLKVAQSVSFSNAIAYLTGTDGTWYAEASTTPHTFSSAGSDFVTSGVQIGDILVSGAYGSDNVGTYRIVSVGATSLDVEAMDGNATSTVAVSDQPWRIHARACADSSVVGIAAYEAEGCSVRVRALGPSNISSGIVISPVETHSIPTSGAWTDALAGLGCRTDAGAIAYTASVQAANAANSSDLVTKYQNAIDALLADAAPANSVNIVVSARAAAGIANKLREHVDAASSQGKGRICVVSPGVQTLSLATVVGSTGSATDTAFGVAATGAAGRDDRVIYSWPAVQTQYPSAKGILLNRAAGYATDTGMLDVQADVWLASVMSNLPPENNPAQGAPPVPTVLQNVLGYGKGTPALKIADYTQMRESGICAIRFDSTSTVFQSGVTTSLASGEKNIARRRMADYIQDSLTAIYQNYVKMPLTVSLKSSIVNETVAFLEDLKSPNNVSAQRIVDYLVDGKSANTPALEAQGIYQVIVKVRTLATADFLVLNSSIGETVSFTTA